MSDILIEVDDLAVEVDEDEYARDPAAVMEGVRTARAALVGDLSDIHAMSPDYTELVEAFGEDF